MNNTKAKITNPAILQAMKSVESVRPKAEAEPSRPIYHFAPPANWMNDPNGTIYAAGHYQLFYQHNPYGDEWGHMHWGHARSRDLIHWEHLPIALWPSKELGEDHVFSGCAAINGSGQPMLFYTMVGPGDRNNRPDNQQWAGLGDEEWITWKKHPENPILSLDTHGGPAFTGEWRDPYIFHEGGRTFMVVAGATEETAGVALYEATDDSLAHWQYQKLLYSKPTSEIRFFECPNFFKVPGAGGESKWILLSSPYATIQYVVGQFHVETLTFTPETEGILDAGQNEQGSPHFYASNTLYAPDGRCILLGWIRGFPAGRGWNGCLALPRLITVGSDGRPRQVPVNEVDKLRGKAVNMPDLSVTNQRETLQGVAGNTLELVATLQLHEAKRAGFVIGGDSQGSNGVEISFDGASITVAGCAVPLNVATDAPLSLRLFVDRSVIELFVNDGAEAITKTVDGVADYAPIAAFADGGTANFTKLASWFIGSIW